MKHVDSIPRSKGVYLLVISIEQDIDVKTRRKFFHIVKGTYIYVGSAQGPGGLRSRLLRYLKHPNRLFWHIDYLLSSKSARLLTLCFTSTEEDLESQLASKLRESCNPVVGFGSSDKRMDVSHLFQCSNDLNILLQKLSGVLPGLNCVSIR